MRTKRRPASWRATNQLRTSAVFTHSVPLPMITLLVSIIAWLPTSFAHTTAADKIPFPGRVIDGSTGQPVVGVKVVSHGNQQDDVAVTDDQGAFIIGLNVDSDGRARGTLMVETDDGRIGVKSVDQAPLKLNIGLVGRHTAIVVGPSHPLVVEVCDEAGSPVSDAAVTVVRNLGIIATGLTDTAGTWRCRLPAAMKHWEVLAHKSNVGSDYVTARLSKSSQDVLRPLPDQLRLKLDGAFAIRVRALDQAGKPVSDVQVSPTFGRKIGYTTATNFAATISRWPATDVAGNLVLDWLPKPFDTRLLIDVRPGNGCYPVQRQFIVPAVDPPNELTVKLLPYERLAGRVTFSDGRPAPDVDVMARGQGEGTNQFVEMAQTDSLGRFAFRAYSEQAYTVTVKSREWAARHRTGVFLRAGCPVNEVDFTLVRATRVHGRIITDSTVQSPALKFVDAELLPPIGGEPMDRTLPYRSPTPILSAKSNAAGHYELFLSPGDYVIRGPWRTQARISIPEETPASEIECHLHSSAIQADIERTNRQAVEEN